jgi:hypothetical protein
VDTESSPSNDDNEGIEMIDSMENNLAMMGLGETGFFILMGARSAGSSISMAFDVLVAFYVAGMIANPSGDRDEEDSSTD